MARSSFGETLNTGTWLVNFLPRRVSISRWISPKSRLLRTLSAEASARHKGRQRKEKQNTNRHFGTNFTVFNTPLSSASEARILKQTNKEGNYSRPNRGFSVSFWLSPCCSGTDAMLDFNPSVYLPGPACLGPKPRMAH